MVQTFAVVNFPIERAVGQFLYAAVSIGYMKLQGEVLTPEELTVNVFSL
jgi:hypothetical protein